MPKDQVLCSACKFVFSDLPDINSVSACPNCGSHDRQIYMSDTGRLYEKVKVKQKNRKRTGEHKTNIEITIGDDLHVASGKWNVLERIVDRDKVVDGEKGTYFEKLIDGETGQVLKLTEGPLSAHQGYGDAKRRKANP